MAWCRIDQVPSIHYATWILASWGLAALLGLLLHIAGRKTGRSGWMAAGIAVMSVPAWMTLLLVVPDMVKTFCVQGDVVLVVQSHGVPTAPSAAELLSQGVDAAQRNVGYPLAGFLLFLHGRQQQGRLQATWSGKVAELVPVGRGLWASTRLGFAVFPVLAAVNLLLLWSLGLQFRAAGASSYYGNIDAAAALALALAAGIGEEIVFRGVMQQGFKRLLAPHLGRWLAMSLAITLQAVPFAYAHNGYGNPTLLLFNIGFAVLAGLTVEFVGLGAAVALHALIDFFAFFTQAAHPDWLFWTTTVAVALAVVACAVTEAKMALARRRSPDAAA